MSWAAIILDFSHSHNKASRSSVTACLCYCLVIYKRKSVVAARNGLVVRISSWVNRIKWEVELRRAISVILGGVKRSVGIIKYDIVVMENVMLIMMTRAGGSQAQNSSRPPHLLFCLHLSDPACSAPPPPSLRAGTRNGDTKVLFKTLNQNYFLGRKIKKNVWPRFICAPMKKGDSFYLFGIRNISLG